MAGKAMIPAPIDRPLAKAYLRKFTGWSTAYPPGTSDATTLRVMHNCSINADSSLRIRPGMRRVLSAPLPGDIVGEIEHFYTAGGVKALLFAIRDDANSRVVFRTAVYNSATKLYEPDAAIATRFPGATDADLAFGDDCTYVRYVQIDNKVLALSNTEEPFRVFWVGATPKAKSITAVTRPNFDVADRLTVMHPTSGWIAGSQTTVPTVETAASGTLISSTAASNVYNFAYFYTFNNEIGETAGSQVTVAKAQRRWAAWTPNATDDSKAVDQLAAIIPVAAWNAAVAAGAVSWNLYSVMWSDQDAVPVEGILLKTTDMVGKTRAQAGWATHTPMLQALNGSHTLPSATVRDNFTVPSNAGNGLVAGDRVVLVYDQANGARIQWSSNQQGDYLNFSASKGGGFKTLTSGNLYLTAAVKLWQNPQSTDTITVLCAGLDGYGTSYYMNANTTVTTQSQSALVMGFEETTATPGTVSPYAVEVLNNALFHPLENNLMKSTASNYNINHLLIADAIQNLWHRVPLADKRKMVSAQMDSSLYYLVQSPIGWVDAPEANGNQIWICDTALTNAWSCWDVAGTSLKKLEVDGLLYMSVVSGPSIFVFDPEYDSDDVWTGTTWSTVGIPWEAVTNTQGANRAHDAWAHLQQINVTFGNFTGECEYGIRGKDRHGNLFELKKHFVSPERTHSPLDRFDQQDFLLCKRDVMEWEFFWKSADRPKNRSYGSVGYIQYRYTPVSVNVGYEHGSIETFEYQASASNSSNGVGMPYADRARP